MLKANFSAENVKPSKLGSLKGLKTQKPKLPFDQNKIYDIVIIGGGTGGISCAGEARKLGLSVALFDYVTPTPHGTQWGLGGTCVNVGCIPKKLMHISTQVKENTHSLKDYGWPEAHDTGAHDWMVLRNNV